MEDYVRNLKDQIYLSEGRYGKTEIIQFGMALDKKRILIKGKSENIKPYVLISISYENDFFVHRVISTFFKRDGLDKYFTIESGQHWNGGEVSDDLT